MNKSNTSLRLKEIMRLRNLKQVDILKLCEPYCNEYGIKLNKNDLSQYVSGKVQPGQDKLSILAYALNVNEVWLMGYDVDMSLETDEINSFHKCDNIFKIEKKKFPLLGEIACGKPIFVDEDRESYVMAGTDIQADFCLKCKGDSMINARINNGDIVFIKQQNMVNNGEIAAVIIDNEATLKRFYYYKEANLVILKAENPKVPDFEFQGEQLNQIRVIGKAVAFQSDVI